MGKDKVVIVVVSTIVFSAILFGILIAYKTYYSPMKVYNSIDEHFRMEMLSMFNVLSRSCKMKDYKTGEVRKFTKQEMNEFYTAIGGKEAVIKYLSNIEDKEKQREELEYACYDLKIITSDELANIEK